MNELFKGDNLTSITLNNITVSFPNTKAVDDVSLTFTQGEFICILGKSGAGKSTLIRCINGLQRPTSGEVTINDVQIHSLSEDKLRFVRKHIGMIFQHFHLLPRLSVLTNVLTGAFGRRPAWKNLLGLFQQEEIKAAKEAIQSVELTPQTNNRVDQLSGGQKQRVGIARALLQQPKIFLGDEPVASLDPSTSNVIFTLLKQIHDRKQLITVINVHDVTLAKQYATRIIGLREGKVVFDGKPEQFTEQTFETIYGKQGGSFDE